MDFQKRKPNRLKNYNYNLDGSYFTTICSHNKEHLFGEIVGDGLSVPNDIPKILLSKKGEIVKSVLWEMSLKYPNSKIDKYCIMPNHIHLILTLQNGTENPSPTISRIIAWYEFETTKQINNINDEKNKIWQRSFYDHIIRNEKDYSEIWNYIDTNEVKWQSDCFY